jgi:putative membrane protein
MKLKFLLLALSVAALPVVSLNAQTSTSTSTTSTTTPTLNDHQIAEILEVANDAEISAAKEAEDDAKNAEVKTFAKHMIEEHKMNNKSMKKVVKASDIDPEKSEMSKALKEDSKNKLKMLKKQKDMAFDKMYIEQQVTMHTQLLNDLDSKYIPAAQKPELKAHLQATREHVSKHLDQAKAIQAKL